MSTPANPPVTGSLKGDITVAEPTRYERSVARRSAEIRATVPHAEFSRVVGADAALAVAERDGIDLSALVLAATARALRARPRVNGAYRDGRFELYSRVNIGVTLVADGVYVAPTVFDSDLKSANDLANEVADYAARARRDALESAELTGATFTFTDLADTGLTNGAPLVVGGQAAGLAVGAVRAVPVLSDGAVVPGHELTLTLSVDHRILQSEEAGRFLAEIATGLEMLA